MSLLSRAGLAVTLSLFSLQSWAIQVPGPLVDVDWLSNQKSNVVILDVRKDTKSFTAKSKKGGKIAGMQGCGAKKGSGIKVAGHIPGATLVSWKLVRKKRAENGVDLIKLVPTKAEMETLMREHGVNSDSAVVITSKGATSKDITFGTRLYWQMKYWGHDNVAILDGGTAAWAAAGNSLERNKSKPSEGNWMAKGPNKELLATTDDVEAISKSGGQLIDGRTDEYFLGSTYKKKYVYAAGHIPGAKNMPHTLLVKGETAAFFEPKDKLEKLMKVKGINSEQASITYCDSGHLSTGHWFVMHELMGNKEARLFDGSMHEWTKRKLPVVGL